MRSEPAVPPLGLIAGEGVFPLLVAQGAQQRGRRVVCCALPGSAVTDLRRLAWRLTPLPVSRMQSWIDYLRFHGCREAIMVGRVAKAQMHDLPGMLRQIPDLRTTRAMVKLLRTDHRPQAVLDTLIRELKKDGITVTDSTQYCGEHLSTAGVMTRRAPSEREWSDLRHGLPICRRLSQMDIGQCLAMKNREVIAVEALEGTDAMLRRAGSLCRDGGWVLVKVSNKRRDKRLDVPTLGLHTIERLHQCGCTALGVEAGHTILLEKPKLLELADRYGIAVVGFDSVEAAAADGDATSV